jgi:hypothetical protein
MQNEKDIVVLEKRRIDKGSQDIRKTWLVAKSLWRKRSFFLYDKVKLHSVECFLHGMLVEPIGHLGAVFSHFDPLYQFRS